MAVIWRVMAAAGYCMNIKLYKYSRTYPGLLFGEDGGGRQETKGIYC